MIFVLRRGNHVVTVIGFMEQLEQSRISREKRARGSVHVLARELITRENNIIERIIGQESETPLSAGPTGPLITSLFHVNVLHDINYLGGWPIGRIQRGPMFPFSPFLSRSFRPLSHLPFFLATRFNPFIADRGRSFDRDFHPAGKFFRSSTASRDIRQIPLAVFPSSMVFNYDTVVPVPSDESRTVLPTRLAHGSLRQAG